LALGVFVALSKAITKKGALALTRALMGGAGLPALRVLKLGRVKKMEETGLMTLAVGLTQCPRVEEWDMDNENETYHTDYESEEDRPRQIRESLRAILRNSRSEGGEYVKIIW